VGACDEVGACERGAEPDSGAASERGPESAADSERGPEKAAGSEGGPELVAGSEGGPELAAGSERGPESPADSERAPGFEGVTDSGGPADDPAGFEEAAPPASWTGEVGRATVGGHDNGAAGRAEAAPACGGHDGGADRGPGSAADSGTTGSTGPDGSDGSTGSTGPVGRGEGPAEPTSVGAFASDSAIGCVGACASTVPGPSGSVAFAIRGLLSGPGPPGRRAIIPGSPNPRNVTCVIAHPNRVPLGVVHAGNVDPRECG